MTGARVGLIGAGRWGSRVLQAMYRVRGADVVAVHDTASSATEGLPEHLLTDSLEDFLHDRQLHGAVIATPGHTHAELTLRCLHAGVHVLVEKPMAMSVREAHDVVHGVQRTGRQVMVGHIVEFHPGVLRMLDLLRGGTVGNPRSATFERIVGTHSATEDAWWGLAPHDIATARRIFAADPSWVRAARHDQSDNVVARLGFPNGVRADLRVGRRAGARSRVTRVQTTQGLLEFDELGGTLEFAPEGVGASAPNYSIEFERGTQPLMVELERFVDCISGGTEWTSTAYDGAAVVAVLAAGARSARLQGLACPVNPRIPTPDTRYLQP